MTLVSQIITDAFRQGNVISLAASPTTPEQTEGLRYLNRIVKSVLGTEVGENLHAFPVGGANISRPAGYPWWGDVPHGDWFVPKNTRVMLNLEGSLSLYLHPEPNNGSRFAAIDVAGNLSTYPVTVYGNGRLIEAATSITLNTDNLDSEWFYRDDIANWVQYAPLLTSDTFPFPEEFDDFFITLLAMRLNPAYGVAIDQQSLEFLKRSRTQIRARYKQTIPTRSEEGLIQMPLISAEREGLSYDWSGDDNFAFERGWPY